jgi:hypothetical protein
MKEMGYTFWQSFLVIALNIFNDFWPVSLATILAYFVSWLVAQIVTIINIRIIYGDEDKI